MITRAHVSPLGVPPHRSGTKKGLLLGIWTTLGLRGQATAVGVLEMSVANQKLCMGRAELRHLTLWTIIVSS